MPKKPRPLKPCKNCGRMEHREPNGRVSCRRCKQPVDNIKRRIQRKTCAVCGGEKVKNNQGHYRCPPCLNKQKREYKERCRLGLVVESEKQHETCGWVPLNIWGPQGMAAAIQAGWTPAQREQRRETREEPLTIPQLDSAWLLPGGMNDRDVFNF